MVNNFGFVYFFKFIILNNYLVIEFIMNLYIYFFLFLFIFIDLMKKINKVINFKFSLAFLK